MIAEAIEGRRSDRGPTEFRRRLYGNVASNFAGRFVGLISWFALTPLMLRELGVAQYGLWVLIGSLAAYGWLLDVFGGSVVKYVSQHMAKGQHVEASEVVSTALWLYLGLGLLVCLLSLAMAPVVPELFGVAAEDRQLARSLTALMGLTVGLSVAFLPIVEVMKGLHRYDLQNLTRAGGTVLYAASVAVLLLNGAGLLAVVAVNVPITIVMQILTVRLLRRSAPELTIAWRRPSRQTARRLIMFGSGSFALLLTDHLDTRSDEIIIAAFFPIALVAPYSLARRLSSVGDIIAVQFQKVLMPIASAFDAQGRREDLRTTFVVSSRVTLGLLVPSAVLLSLLAADILTLWVGEEYAHAAPLVSVLAAGLVLRSATMPARSVLQGMARQRLMAWGSLSAGLLNIVASIVLIGYFGVMGVAAATALSALVLQSVMVPHVLSVLQIDFMTLLREGWLPALVPIVPMAVAGLAFPGDGSASLSRVVLLTLASLIVYYAGYLMMAASRPERTAVSSMLRRARLIAR